MLHNKLQFEASANSVRCRLSVRTSVSCQTFWLQCTAVCLLAAWWRFTLSASMGDRLTCRSVRQKKCRMWNHVSASSCRKRATNWTFAFDKKCCKMLTTSSLAAWRLLVSIEVSLWLPLKCFTFPGSRFLSIFGYYIWQLRKHSLVLYVLAAGPQFLQICRIFSAREGDELLPGIQSRPLLRRVAKIMLRARKYKDCFGMLSL